jgi:hypothetical protein
VIIVDRHDLADLMTFEKVDRQPDELVKQVDVQLQVQP